MRPFDGFDELVRRVAQSHDRAAFSALFEHFAPRIKAYLLRRGVAAQTAEDLAQEALLVMWRKAGLFDASKASAATWVFTIARNLHLDLARRERRPAVETAELAPEADDNPRDQLESQQSADVLRQALRTLPPEQAEIVMLSYFSDEPHSRIASTLGIPLGTVKSRLRLALARLRESLGDLA